MLYSVSGAHVLHEERSVEFNQSVSWAESSTIALSKVANLNLYKILILISLLFQTKLLQQSLKFKHMLTRPLHK